MPKLLTVECNPAVKDVVKLALAAVRSEVKPHTTAPFTML
jgi:hypothetical protein